MESPTSPHAEAADLAFKLMAEPSRFQIVAEWLADTVEACHLLDEEAAEAKDKAKHWDQKFGTAESIADALLDVIGASPCGCGAAVDILAAGEFINRADHLAALDDDKRDENQEG